MVSSNLIFKLVGACFLLRASASPTPQLQSRGTISDFCANSYKGTKELWNEIGVGDWFQIIASKRNPHSPHMYGVDTGMTGLTPKPWDDNIVSTLKRYAPGVNSLECNTLDDCDVVFTDKICMDGGGMPYFVFRAIENYNRYLKKIQTTIGSVHDKVQGLVPAMPKIFTNDGDAPPEDFLTKFFGIAQAITGAVSMAVPEAEFVDAGLGIIAGVYDTFKEDPKASPEELIYDGFAGASEGLSKAVTAMQNSLYGLANKTFREIPSNEPGYKYSDDPLQLVRILHDGAFASDRSSQLSTNPPEMIGLLSSVVINYLWQREKVIVVKTSPGVWGAEICDTTIWTGNTWCTPDHAHAYTLLGYTPIETFTTGTDDPDLEIGDPMDTVRGIQNLTNYELDLETVVLASEWTQSQTKKFRSEIPADILRNTLTTPGEQQHKELKGVFNLPFCDLEVLIPKNQEFMKSIDCELGKNTDSGKQASCWKQAVICLCGNLQDTDGQWLSDYEDWMKPDNMCTDVIPTNLAGKDPLEGVIDLLCPIAIGGTLCTA